MTNLDRTVVQIRPLCFERGSSLRYTELCSRAAEDVPEVLEENRASSKVYESLLQAQDDMGLGFFVHEAGRLSYANESCSRISGYSLEELGAMPSVYSLVVPEQRDLLLERLRRRRQGRHDQQVVEHYESAIVRKDGRRIDVELVVKPLRDGDERQAVLLRDITDRKNTEKAIKESEERFRSAFENASTGVALVGLDRRATSRSTAPCARCSATRKRNS